MHQLHVGIKKRQRGQIVRIKKLTLFLGHNLNFTLDSDLKIAEIAFGALIENGMHGGYP